MKRYWREILATFVLIATCIGIGIAALPATLDTTIPANAEALALGAGRIRAIKTFLVDVFGVPDGVSIASPSFAINTLGIASAYYADGTVQTSASSAPKGHIYGCTLSNNAADATNDIDIAACEAVSDGSSGCKTITVAAMTKQTNAAWVAGTGAGCMDTGSVANGMLHIFAIHNNANFKGDVLCSASATAPTMPTGYTKKRRVGSIPRELGVILPFIRDEDLFQRKIPVNSYEVTGPISTGPITVQLHVASGIAVTAILGFSAAVVTGENIIVSDLETTNTVPTAQVNNFRVGANGQAAGQFYIRSASAGQVRYRMDTSDGSASIRLVSFGWLDSRGRLD